jgi:hypothetical protein
MRKVKIIFSLERRLFFVDDADFQQAIPEKMPTITSFVADLNAIPTKNKVGTSSWIWIIFVLYLVSFFLIFVRWYLVFIPVAIFILFIGIMTYFGRIWFRFRQEINTVCLTYIGQFTNFYEIDNKFNKAHRRMKPHHMMIVLKPIVLGMIARPGMMPVTPANNEPIPIYAYNPYIDTNNQGTRPDQPFVQTANGMYNPPTLIGSNENINNGGYAAPQPTTVYTPNVYQVPRAQHFEAYDVENQNMHFRQNQNKQE